MAGINMESIMDKAKAYVNSSEFQKKAEAKVDEIVLTGGKAMTGKAITIGGASVAADKFIEVLQNEIRGLEASSGFADGKLGHTAVDALEKLYPGTPVKVGKNRYQIEVWFGNAGENNDGYLHRDSLALDYFDEGINNIAALLNKGYKTKSENPIYGVWMNHSGSFNILSLPQRSGAQFIQNAIRNYMENYASEYGVIDIEIDDIYK